MNIFLWVIGVCLSFALVTLIYKKIDAVKALVIGTGSYFSSYIVVSGLLIWADKFSVLKAELVTAILLLILSVVTFMIKKSGLPSVTFDPKKFISLAIVMVALAFLSHNKGELFSTSQDQGLYQERAMMYMGDYNDNTLEFEEYQAIDNPGVAATYITSLNEMEGIYLVDGSAARYQIHGVGTFAALLALWGKMFGLHNMTGVLTVFLLVTVGAVFIICDNLGMRWNISLGVAAITGVCPAVMWSSKNILTEIGLCMLIAMFFAMATEDSKKRISAWCALPLIAFGYYHITITITMPLIVVMLVWMYITSKKRDMLICIVLTLSGYLTGLKMMYDSALIYTVNNLGPIFDRTNNRFNKDNFMSKVTIICVVIMVVLVVLDITGVIGKLQKFTKKLPEAKLNRVLWTIIAVAAAAGLILMFVNVGMKNSENFEKLSIWAFLYMTGFVMLPLAFLSLVIFIRDFVKDSRLMILAMAFVYVMIVYASFLWPIVKYYYYYLRYFAPYMFIVPVLAGYLLERIPVKYVSSAVTVVAIGALIYTSSLLYTDKDLTYGDFEVVEGIVSHIEKDSAVIMLHDEYAIDRMLMLPIKALSGADMYFVDVEDFVGQAELLSTMYENVYYVKYDAGYVDDGTHIWEYVYQDSLHASLYTHEPAGVLPYQMGVDTFNSSVGLFIYNGAN